jgi:hypothetical protein
MVIAAPHVAPNYFDQFRRIRDSLAPKLMIAEPPETLKVCPWRNTFDLELVAR